MPAPLDYTAYYPLTDDVHDETGNHNGTNHGVTFDGRSGLFNPGYIDVNSLHLDNSQFTISFYYSLLSRYNEAHCFFDSKGDSNRLFIEAYWDFAYNLGVYDGSGFRNSNHTTLVSKAMTHISFIFFGPNFDVLVNGVFCCTISNSSYARVLEGTNNRIGKIHNANWKLNGRMAHWRFYNYALTRGQGLEVYKENIDSFMPKATIIVNSSGDLLPTKYPWSLVTIDSSIEAAPLRYPLATINVNVNINGIADNKNTILKDYMFDKDAILSGDYTRNVHSITFNDDIAQADTLFVLPDNVDWLIMEAYDIDDVAGKIAAHKYTDDTKNYLQKFEEFRQELKDDNNFLNFKVAYTKYNHETGLVDTYKADQTNSPSLYETGLTFIFGVDPWLIKSRVFRPKSTYDTHIEMTITNEETVDISGIPFSVRDEDTGIITENQTSITSSNASGKYTLLSNDRSFTSISFTGNYITKMHIKSLMYVENVSNLFKFLSNLLDFTWSGEVNPTLRTMSEMFGSGVAKIDISASVMQNITSAYKMFEYCSSLVDLSLLGTGNVINWSYAFRHNKLLGDQLANIDFSGGINFSWCWAEVVDGGEFPNLDLSSGTNFERAWYQWGKDTSGEFNFLTTSLPSCTNAKYIFSDAYINIPNLSVPSLRDFTQMFRDFKGDLPLVLDISLGTNFYAMFTNFSGDIPYLDTSSGTNFYAMFNITTTDCILELDTRNATDVGYMFADSNISSPDADEQLAIAQVPGILWTSPGGCP